MRDCEKGFGRRQTERKKLGEELGKELGEEMGGGARRGDGEETGRGAEREKRESLAMFFAVAGCPRGHNRRNNG